MLRPRPPPQAPPPLTCASCGRGGAPARRGLRQPTAAGQAPCCRRRALRRWGGVQGGRGAGEVPTTTAGRAAASPQRIRRHSHRPRPPPQRSAPPGASPAPPVTPLSNQARLKPAELSSCPKPSSPPPLGVAGSSESRLRAARSAAEGTIATRGLGVRLTPSTSITCCHGRCGARGAGRRGLQPHACARCGHACVFEVAWRSGATASGAGRGRTAELAPAGAMRHSRARAPCASAPTLSGAEPSAASRVRLPRLLPEGRRPDCR
jgi:hypothetical protein